MQGRPTRDERTQRRRHGSVAALQVACASRSRKSVPAAAAATDVHDAARSSSIFCSASITPVVAAREARVPCTPVASS